jgi:hypothetical protein
VDEGSAFSSAKTFMSILEICQWLQETPPGRMVREGYWGYGIPQMVHLGSMALFGGSVVLDDLRLLGAIRKPAVSELSAQLAAVKWVGFLLAGSTGILLFMSDATRFYKNPAFLIKSGLLLLIALNAWIFRSVVYKDVRAWDDSGTTPAGAKVVAAVSLFLWICVIAASRAIGFTLSDT